MKLQLEKNLIKQEKTIKKIESLKLELVNLKEKQIELENETVLKEFRNRKISLDEFLKMVRENKKEEKKEKALVEMPKQNEENKHWRIKQDEESK